MTIRNFLLLVALFAFSLQSFAGKQKYNGRLSTEGTGPSELVSGNAIFVEDPQYTNYITNSLTWPMDFKDISVRNRVIFRVNQESSLMPSGSGECKVKVNITYISYSGGIFSTHTISNKELKITPSAGKDKVVYDFEGGYNLQIQLVEPPTNSTGYNLVLEGEMEIERYYNFDASINYSGNLSHCSALLATTGELEIFWDPVTGAEEYDLEWVFVNNYSPVLATNADPDTLKVNENLFRFNSTRITTSNTFYRLPYLYERGYILYRIRATGRTSIDNYSSMVPGKWSYDNSSSIDNVGDFVNRFPNTSLTTIGCNDGTEVFVTHEQKLNWQSSVSYAEEGKSKAIVSYLDGSLHGRQSVTKIKTNEEVVVGETIYDHEGRPAINVLPVPTGTGMISYKHSFNKKNSTDAYTKADFDLDNSSCSTLTPIMDSTVSGASKYYSSEISTGENQVIPSSMGYPFTQVEYTPDNTGRINAQSGVGPIHKLGSGHETKYLYGTPYQESLDRLFGSEAGNANRYKQNMVIDANGQVSISYLAPDGKVIATSLAGKAPGNTDPLESNISDNGGEPPVMTIDLINKVMATDNSGLNNVVDPATGTITVKENITVPVQGEYTFSYEVQPPKLDSSCSVTHQVITSTNPLSLETSTTTENFCYNCVYDLTISLKDDCGNELVQTLKASGTPETNTAVIGTKSDSCGVSQTNFSSDGYFNINNPSVEDAVNLTTGTYSLTKSLNLNQAVLEEYANNYITSSNNCLLSLTDFYAASLAEADFSGCNITCAECIEQLGNYSNYSGDSCSVCLSYEEFLALQDQCNARCNYKSTKCESAYQAMLADVTPGGQYCQYTTGGTTNSNGVPVALDNSIFMPWAFPLSLLSDWNTLPRKAATNTTFTTTTNHAFAYNGSTPIWVPGWRNPYNPNESTDAKKFAYLNENGEVDLIPLTPLSGGGYEPAVHWNNVGKIITDASGAKWIEPRYLNSAEDFKNLWKLSWAKSLVYTHPEYRLYERCLSDNASNDFDSEMTLPDSLNAIQALPAYTSAELFNPVGNMPSGSTTVIDPYFATGGNGDTALATIQNAMINYLPIPGTSGPVLYYTIWEAVWVMQNCPNTDNPSMTCTTCSLPGTVTLSTQKDWELFQPMYLGLKQSVQDRINMKYAIDGGCYNGCIGDEQFNPYDYGFFANTTTYINPWNAIWNYTPWDLGSLNTSQYFNAEQPCNVWARSYYKNKKPRFATTNQMLANVSPGYADQPCYDEYGNVTPCAQMDEDDIAALKNEAALNNYQTCKQCPAAANLQSLLSGLAQIKSDNVNEDLTANSDVLLSCYPASEHAEYIPDLHSALGFAAGDDAKWTYNTTDTTHVVAGHTCNYLTGTIHNTGSTEVCTLKLVMPYKLIDEAGALPSQLNPAAFVNPYTFDDVTDICCLSYKPSTGAFIGSTGNFTCQVTVKVKSSDSLYIPGVVQYRNIQVEGDISCLNLRDCEFEPVCNASNEAMDFQNLLNALLFKVPGGTPPVDFFNTSVNLSTEPYNAFLSENLVTQLNGVSTPTLTTFTWNEVSSIDNVFTGNISGGSDDCDITITVTDVAVDAADIVKLSGIRPTSTPGNFTATALIRSGGVLSYKKVTGSAPCINFGACSTEISLTGSLNENEYSTTLMCPIGIQDGRPIHPFADFLKDPANIAMVTSGSPQKYYFSEHRYFTTKVGDECSLYLTIPPNPYDYTLSQIVAVNEVYADPDYIHPPSVMNTTHILIAVTMNDSNTFIIKGNAPCEHFYGCTGSTFDNCIPVEVVVNGDFNMGNQDFTNTFATYGVDTLTQLSDHTTCGQVINPSCNTGRYLYLNPYSASATKIGWEQQVLLYPNTDYTFSFYHAATNPINVRFEILLDGTQIDESHCLTSTVGCTMGTYQSQNIYWTQEYFEFSSSTYSITTASSHTLSVRVLAEAGEATLAFDDFSLTYCGAPNSYMCNLPPPAAEIEIDDDCIENAINNAIEGAQNEYNEYIAEQKLQFKEIYKRHCLDVYESFNMKYPDTEHHFTLYYYDEAGNLERTIPPNGVVFVTGNDKLDQVALDRANGTHTVFTEHTYATTYTYNSLNQLLTQSMPDHQDMATSGSASLTGINASHHVQSLSFNNTSGLAVANDGTNGYIYTYNATGNSWDLITGITVNNLNDVVFINSTTAYAVGDNGTVLYTTNTGTTWNVLPFPNVNKNLVRLHKDAASGTNVYVYDNAGGQWLSSASGTTWTAVSSGFTLGGGETIVDIDIEKSSGDGWALTSTGRFFKTNVYSAPNSWTAVSGAGFHTVDLTAIAHNGTDFYAFGNDGTVLKSGSGLSTWQELESSVSGTTGVVFKQVIFISSTVAFGIDASCMVYKNTDGAKTFTASTPAGGGETIKQLQLQSGRLWALSSAGNLYYYASGAWVTTSVLSSPVSGAQSLYMTSNTDGYIGDNAGTLYSVTTTLSVTSAAPTFTTTPFGSNSINELYFPTFASGYVLTGAGTQNVSYVTNSGTPTATALGSSSDVYSHMFPSSSSGLLFAIDPSGTVVNVTSSGYTGVTTISGASGLSAFSIAAGKETAVVGSGGKIYPFSGTSAEFTSAVSAPAIQLPELTAVSAISSTVAVACGKAGTIIKTSNSGADWQVLETATYTDLNDISSNGTYMYAAGDASATPGFNDVVYGTISGSLSKVANPASGSIRKTYTNSSNNAYLIGDNNSVATVSSAGATASYGSSGSDLAGLDESSGNLFVAGDAGSIYYGAVNALALQSTFIPPVLNDVNYFDNTHALGVGNGGSIMATSDGGNHWAAVSISGGTGDKLSALTMVSATQAYAVGDNGSIVSITRSGSTYTAVVVSATGLSGNLNDIEYADGYYVAVSSNGHAYEATTVSSWSYSTSSGDALNAVSHKNGHFACAVGDNGKILIGTRGYGTSDVFTWTASTNGSDTWSAHFAGSDKNQSDVYFLDYTTGYLAGEDGLVLKSVNGGVTWTQETYGTLPSTDLNAITAAPGTSTYITAGNAGAVTSVADRKSEFSTHMYYDKLGRLVASQNSKQFAANANTYSYTMYDALGRITEVGEYVAGSSIESLPGTVNGQVDLTQFLAWIYSNPVKTQVTRTYYDEATSTAIPGFTVNNFNLRNRVAYTVYLDNTDRTGFSSDYEHATYFNYDIHGNVKTMIQHNPYMAGDNQYKRLDYDYDLISGKVNEVVYQQDFIDEFHHKYEYDADNRITNVYTSSDGILWDQDAKYFYYKHGPLSRTETGDLKVQGTDYAYTINGWIKGVNSNSLNAAHDIGTDGAYAIGGNVNTNVAQDKYGYSLGYFAKDYVPKNGSSVSFIAGSGVLATDNVDLYNGNISNMTTTITDYAGAVKPLASLYK